jgi:DNA-binding NtrC family response regulator
MSTQEPTHSIGPKARSAPRLVVFWDGGAVSKALPGTGTWIIGRGEDVHVRVDHPSVSRRHVALHLTSSVRIEDLGSANGTRVAGRALVPRQPVALASGDIVSLGDARLMIQAPTDEGQPAATAEPRSGPVGAAMRAVYETAERMALGTISVLLLGETGVGKEILATHIHEASKREGPFLRLNCAAVSETLVESELFGHEKGAFTGAAKAKSGLLEAASGGTVLLDEVADLSIGMQSKLLRALENREVFRVGSVRPTTIDVRFLAATSRDVHALVADGRFRADLYYRLGGAVIRIPPLRERTEEIRSLAELLLRASAERMRRAPPRLHDHAVSLLERHAWPGNVRELRNVVERAILLAPSDEIGPSHVVFDDAPPPSAASVPSFHPPETMRTVPPADAGKLSEVLSGIEKERILAALEACGGNQTRAAEMLGMRRATLVARLDAYGVKRPRRR